MKSVSAVWLVLFLNVAAFGEPAHEPILPGFSSAKVGRATQSESEIRDHFCENPHLSICFGFQRLDNSEEDLRKKWVQAAMKAVQDKAEYQITESGTGFFKQIVALPLEKRRDALADYYQALEEGLGWETSHASELVENMKKAIADLKGPKAVKDDFASLLKPTLVRSMSELIRKTPVREIATILSHVSKSCHNNGMPDGSGDNALTEIGWGVAFCPGTLFRARLKTDGRSPAILKIDYRKLAFPGLHEFGHFIGAHPEHPLRRYLDSFLDCFRRESRHPVAKEEEMEIAADKFAVEGMLPLLKTEFEKTRSLSALFSLVANNLKPLCGLSGSQSHWHGSTRLNSIYGPPICSLFRKLTGLDPDYEALEILGSGPAPKCELKLESKI